MNRSTRLPVPLEAEVQKSCLKVLEAFGVLAWRSNTGAFRVPGKGGRQRLMRAGLGNGSADIVGILPGYCSVSRSGRFFALEVKRPGGRPTPGQIAWLQGVNQVGGLALWVDSAQLLIDALNYI